jgi:hypothetical protein
MKYLKTYEDLSFKNYVIMSHSWMPNTLFICRPFNTDNLKNDTEIAMLRVFQYDMRTSEFLKNGNIYYYNPEKNKSTNILYQTDSLEDAKKNISIVASKIKYNV